MKFHYFAIIVLVGVTASIFVLSIHENDFTTYEFLPSFKEAEAEKPRTHNITLAAVQLMAKHPHHDTPVLAYKMVSHEVIQDKGGDDDGKKNKKMVLTDNYPTEATIPGPTLIIDEGDLVNITLENHLGSGCVSLHVHGIHYGIESDGTLSMINGEKDSCAIPHEPYTYVWKAGKGTAGTWPYHDHTLATGEGHMHMPTVLPTEGSEEPEFGTSMHGSSSKGLFGALIINPKDKKVDALIDGKETKVPLKKIEKEFILYMIGTRFYGNEVDNSNGIHKALWENPNLIAKLNDKVRFHVISLGTDSGAFHKMAPMDLMMPEMAMPMDHIPEEFHTFHIHGHHWIDAGTSNVIDTKTQGPAESMQFVIKAGESVGVGDWMYHCHVLHHMTMGMWSKFSVTPNGGQSIPGMSWDTMMHIPHSEA